MFLKLEVWGVPRLSLVDSLGKEGMGSQAITGSSDQALNASEWHFCMFIFSKYKINTYLMQKEEENFSSDEKAQNREGIQSHVAER